MIEQSTPRIEIHLNKITHNAKMLKRLFAQKGVKITGVIKGGAGSIEIARAVLNAGIHSLADSRIKNIKKFKKAGLNSSFMLLRIPALSEVSEVVQYADISLNSDLDVIHALSREAKRQNKIHKIILMVEMGDLREGNLTRGTSFVFTGSSEIRRCGSDRVRDKFCLFWWNCSYR